MYIYRVLAWYITNNNYVFIYIYVTNLTNVENRAIDSIPLSIFKIVYILYVQFRLRFDRDTRSSDERSSNELYKLYTIFN